MPHARADDGTLIHYTTHGTTGPWVVLIQGLGLSSQYWGDQTAEIAKDHRAILIDNRGTGKSDRAPGTYRLQRLADDVAAVMDAAALDRAYIVGISMGGMVAQHFAIRHGRRVEGLVLLATTPGIPHGALPSPRGLRFLARVPIAIAFGGREKLYEKMFFGTRPPERAKELATHLLATWGPLMKVDRISLGQYLLQFRAVALHSSGRRLPGLTCKTHVVHGTDDAIVPVANAARLTKLIRGSTMELLPGVGHAIPVEDPDVIRRSVKRLGEAA